VTLARTRTLTFAASALVAASLLTGCAAINAVAKAQTHAAACLQIGAELKAVGTGITTEANKLASDPTGASKAISKYAQTFSAAVSKLSNPTVKAKATIAAKQLTALSGDLTTLTKNPSSANLKKLQNAEPSFQTAMVGIESACKA
jgi:hypothetical protein